MRIFAADDEPLALEMLTEAITQAAPDAQVQAFSTPSALLKAASEHPGDIAFLDIKMGGMTGVELAKKLKESSPAINIIFVTGYDEYARDALALRASGYIIKPVTAQMIRAELSELRRPVAPKPHAVLRVKCFGNFEAFTTGGKKLIFKRTKAKELLAYLVYRSGASCSTREIAAVLFEDSEYDRSKQDYAQKIISTMMKGLRAVGAERAVVRDHNSLSINVALVDCDYYRFSQRDAAAVNAYSGEFMSQYGWAEFAIGYLDKASRK